jgi:peptidoglycan-N-acetylglucosamine deacetylase
MTRRVTRWVTAVLLLVGSPLALATTPAGAASSTPRPCSRGLVALTFDDGPSTTVTGRLLDVLAQRKVPATFFVLGERVAAAPGLARSAYRRGFVIANHSFGHEQLTRLSDDGIRATLSRTTRALRHAGVRPSGLMRPPYGAVDSRVRSVVAGMGLTPVLWDIDPRDWQSGTAATIASRVLGALRPGGSNIVLLHDGVQRSPTTLAAVPAIVRRARARGYCFAGLGATGRPVPPVPRVRVSDARVTEADPGGSTTLRFTLGLDLPTSRKVSVRVRTAELTAHAGADFRAVDRRVEFAVGQVTRQVSVRVRGDRVDEAAERLRLLVSDPRGLTVEDGQGVGTIRDDDPPPSISLDDATVAEPTTGSAPVTVHLALDRPSSRPVSVVLRTVPVTADGLDYVPFEITVQVPAGQLGSDFAVEVLADQVDEPEETFQVLVVSAGRATVLRGVATIRITPPDAEPPARMRGGPHSST